MGLSNHGWGMKEMILYCCVLLTCLLVAVFLINSLYNGLEKSGNSVPSNNLNYLGNTNEKVKVPDKNENQDPPKKQEIDLAYYKKLEDKLYFATEKYLQDYQYDLSTHILKVDLNTLIQLGYMEKVIDSNGSTCTGYSNVLDESGTPKVYAYIKCMEYSTKGY